MGRTNPNRHGGTGKFMDGIPGGNGLDNPERDYKAAEMRRDGKTYKEIADALGWAQPSSAHAAVKRAMLAIPRDGAIELQSMELIRLDAMWTICMNILDANHYAISNGKLMYLGNEPLADYGPILQTLDRMLKIQERRSKLLGLDAPQKSRIEVITEDAMQMAIKDLEAELAQLNG